MSMLDEQVIEEEIAMLTGMLAEIDTSIQTAEENKDKLSTIRAALFKSIGKELPVEDKDQLDFSLVVDGEEVEAISEGD
tara:strand:- start:694 stop:930 length:237 start_codon:yes stop_codon:yes gene_type:complete